MLTSLKALFEAPQTHPLTYCAAGIFMSLFHFVRASWWGLLILICFIGIYAWLAKDDRKNDPHKTGDNCYFIGFVFTLTVITVSLIFDADDLFGQRASASDVSPLLKTIGIALGTSVFGMLCRFGLNDGVKSPPDEIDKNIRLVSVATSELKAQICGLKNEVSATQESLKESNEGMGNAVKQATKSIKTYSDNVEKETKKISQSMSGTAEKLLQDFGKQITDSLQNTHFDSVRESLHTAVEEHQAAVSRIGELLSQSLRNLDNAATVSIANVGGVEQALSSLENSVGGERWAATYNALQEFSKIMESLNTELKTVADRRAATIQEAEKDIQRLREMRSTDLELISGIKNDYQQAFEEASRIALQETQQLYARLIGGATLALGSIESLGEMSKDLRTIARNMEQGEREE